MVYLISQHRVTRLWTAALLLAALVHGGCLASTYGKSGGAFRVQVPVAMGAERTVALPHVVNLRDLGGWKTTSGQYVRQGLVYRSDELAGLDARDYQGLDRLKLKTIIDLRYVAERKKRPEPAITGATNLVADVMAGGVYDADVLSNEDWDLIREDRAQEAMLGLYRAFVRLPSARRAFAIVLRTIAEDPRAVLFHCTAGKDRTGWASALLLTILGVPREQILEDYTLSNALLRQKLIKESAHIAEARPRGTTADQWIPIFEARPEYLQAAFDEAELRYGSFDNYIAKGLGVDERTLGKLRQKLLFDQKEAIRPSAGSSPRFSRPLP